MARLSLITATYNSAATLQQTFDSVRRQGIRDLEYIVIDGASTDGTVPLIEQNQDVVTTWRSEPDQGIYDAMNKGLALATGEVVGILNSDDHYAADDILAQVLGAFEDPGIEAVFGDLTFFRGEQPAKTVRTYRAHHWHPGKFVWGFMPPHPTFFVRRHNYEKFGYFKTDYEIAADYELLIRFLAVHRLPFRYLPLTMVRMRMGGASTDGLRSNVVLNREIKRGCRENGLKTSDLMIYSKYFRKISELF